MMARRILSTLCSVLKLCDGALDAGRCHVAKANLAGSERQGARRLDCLTQETRPRAEDASRVPRRADPVAECDLAEVFATGFDLPAN